MARSTRGSSALYFGAGLALCACAVSPSRTPLGGNYDLPETAAAPDRRAPKAEAHRDDAAAVSAPESASTASATPASSALPGTLPVAKPAGDSVVYLPLKAGDRIKADVALGFDAKLGGSGGASNPFANGNLRLDGKLRVEMKLSRVSASGSAPSIDEVELTVTTLSMHSEFAGHTTDAKSEPPEVYQVTLGKSPSIRARDGSKPDAEERALLLVFVAPLADFHAHWARSPALDLKPGWSSKVPVTLPVLRDATDADRNGENLKVGPFGVRYSGREPRDLASGNVPFDVTLPVQYGADMGTVSVDLTGKATLSETSGRPTSIDMSGPFTARGASADTSALHFAGSARFSATLGYE